jgi:broad specificity phosphatase PhoE
MEVYLVRHGQTDGNVGRRHQHPKTQLNELGRAQAASVAQILLRSGPTHIISSTNLRALETAQIIGEICNLIPLTYPPFEELHQPQAMVGERLTGLRALSYMIPWFFGIRSASMHDGETHEAFVTRLGHARRHLEKLPIDSRVVIVSHSVFINFFIEHMVRPKRMNVCRALIRLIHILLIKNTSITFVRYQTPAPGTGHTGWQMVHHQQ